MDWCVQRQRPVSHLKVSLFGGVKVQQVILIMSTSLNAFSCYHIISYCGYTVFLGHFLHFHANSAIAIKDLKKKSLLMIT